ncbi:MAG TPA: hypothetical protein VMI11_06345, partial [Actinomycetes bacterium]|nr:hypothetical protein [Actinomycetes bacterium]
MIADRQCPWSLVRGLASVAAAEIVEWSVAARGRGVLVRRRFVRGGLRLPVIAVVSAAVVVSMAGAPAAHAAPAADTGTVQAAAAASTPETYERPDWVSAALAARLLKHRVEDTSQRTEVSQTFANPDGTVTTETNQLPVRVQASDGSWQAIDTTLVAGKAGVVPAAVPQDLVFSDGGSGPLVTLGGPGKSKVSVSWPSTLPTPTLSGDTATYAGAVPGADGDLVLTATSTGFELSMVLRSAPASALSLALPVSLTGLTATKGHGGVSLADAKGNVVVYASAGQAYDATTDARSGEAKHSRELEWGLGGTKGAPALTLAPDQAFLTDPSTVYPVTLDPSTTIARSAWTYVQSTNPTTSFYNSSAYARVGSPDGTELNRSLFAFTQDLTGKHILSATLQTLEAYSSSCTASPVAVYAVSGFDSTTTWNTQASVGSALDTQTVAKGFDSVNCPQGSVNFTVTSAVAADVAASQSTYPFELRSATATESDVAGWKKFANNPTLSVTYNTPPLVPDQLLIDSCTTACASPALTRSGTPDLRAVAHDVDGGFETLDFEVWAGNNPSPTTEVTSGTVANVNSNAPGTWKVPSGTLANGSTYEWRVRGDDGTDTGPWTAWYVFSVDTTAPATPSISSSTWPAGAWTSANTGTISWSDTSSDLASYSYQLDANNAVSVPTTTTSFTVTSATPLLNGPHSFKVTAQDNAGNTTSATYSFNVGQAALTSPNDGDQTAQYTLISAAGPSTRPWVTYRYSTTLNPSVTGTNSNPALGFAPIPVGNVVVPGTTTHPGSWPQQASGGVLPSYTWDLKTTLAPTQEPVRVEACLGTSSSDPSPVCSPSPVVTYNEAIQNAATDLGPGSVDLLTGDLSIDETDAAVSQFTGDGLSVGRTLTTKNPSSNTSGASGVFGPGWVADLAGPSSGHADTALTDNSATTGVVTLTDPDATVTEYQLVGSATSYPVSFTGKGDASADGSVLTKLSATSFTLTDADGTVTTWTKTGSAWP